MRRRSACTGPAGRALGLHMDVDALARAAHQSAQHVNLARKARHGRRDGQNASLCKITAEIKRGYVYRRRISDDQARRCLAIGRQRCATAPVVRKDFADSALWLGNLVTDAQGRAKAKFKMPDNLTTWKISGWAVGAKTEVGSVELRVVTRRNLLVRLQAPRFLIQRDEAVLSAIVNNDFATDKQVRVRL